MAWDTEGFTKKKDIKEMIRKAKSNPCTDCGIEYPHYVMDFDHLDRNEKLFNISQNAGRTKIEVLDELEKCELVCANCHRIREHNRY